MTLRSPPSNCQQWYSAGADRKLPARYPVRVASHEQAVRDLAARTGPDQPFFRYSDYLKLRYGTTTYRVSVDAGFTCPVRDRGRPCAYCDARGSRASYLRDEAGLVEQIEGGVGFLKQRYKAERFLLYFQAFSNTYATMPVLRQVYDAGLAAGEFAGLIVSTRPDCFDEPRAALLAEYAQRGLDVWIELGLQSANDRTLRRIHRGHSVAEFDRAARLAKRYGLLTAAHVMLGLDGEDESDAARTARHVSCLGLDGVKFHNLVVTEGTQLYRACLDGSASAPDADAYLNLLIAALEHLDPSIVVMRLTFDPPRGVRTIPALLPDKSVFYQEVVREMARRRTWQGRRLDTDCPPR